MLYQIIFYVPEDKKEKVKEAMFAAGGGVMGNYQRCSFETPGVGQFEPLKESRPYIGEINKLEKVIEFKVEMVCAKNKINEVIAALKLNHPYEEPAYSFYLINQLSN
ncbi:MAG: NGG1p interacting factor NIF3 [Bacteriovoracaceae bacterium]|nr:NGG1p interacting factor NIF3 [Bacteriovoracaceae bacterium]